MVSPSSSSNSRKTPCVEGCCGPMLSVILRGRKSSSGGCAGVSASGVVMPGISPALILNSIPRDGIIFAQRITFPIVRQHDTAQIRMIAEPDAEQVEGLALIPVRAAPDHSDGVNFRALACHPAL